MQEKSIKHESAETSIDCSSKDKESVDLSTCFDAFSKQEKLGEEEMWYCSDCKEFRQATKKMDIWSPPRLLVIHLKRFSYTRYSRDKVKPNFAKNVVRSRCMVSLYWFPDFHGG